MPLLTCPDCNNLVSDLAPACPKCGRPMKAATPPAAQPAPTAAKRVSTGTWISGVLLIILVLVLVWMFSIIWG